MLKKIWGYGTATPVQRVGVIILLFGFLSLFLWVIESGMYIENIFSHFPSRRDSFIFHLYLYLIPIGILMSWGFQILIKLKYWIVSGEIQPNTHPKSKPAKRTETYSPYKNNLHFKNNAAAFEFAESIYSANLNSSNMFFGIIRDVLHPLDGPSFFLIELAISDMKVIVSGFNENTDMIAIGNIVYWGIVENFNEKRILEIQATGDVLAVLNPEFNPNNSTWSVRNNLTK